MDEAPAYQVHRPIKNERVRVTELFYFLKAPSDYPGDENTRDQNVSLYEEVWD
ncbi:hypothetical protein ABID29_001748 [Streptococcus rupicaprae]|uniref:Transposase n=1 Tax=Streptococcus rupicaprae TaxID=759619 RepID=A0ABV2FJA1_9STRE